MNTKKVLRQLGVCDDTLTDEERAFLDAEGYLPLHDVLTSEEAGRLAERVDAILAEEGDAAGRELHASPMIKHPTEVGAARLSDLVNKDAAFDVCFTHPRVLAAIAHVLDGPFKLSSLNSRASLPGHGLQALHADWPFATTPGRLLRVQFDLALGRLHARERGHAPRARHASERTARPPRRWTTRRPHTPTRSNSSRHGGPSSSSTRTPGTAARSTRRTSHAAPFTPTSAAATRCSRSTSSATSAPRRGTG